MLCPCCSNIPFSECCKPIIDGKIPAKSPEALMRSRYTAYAIKNADYIYQTYAELPRQQQSVAEIKTWADSTNWIKLEINNVDRTSTPETVTFTAHYLQKDQYCQLSERSYFIKEDEQWRYSDGDIICHQEIKRVKRNDLCPCGSQKKFKKCCALRS